MRQEGKSGFSSQIEEELKKAARAEGVGRFGHFFLDPASLGSSLERQALPACGSALQVPEESVASQVSYLCKEWLSLVPVSYTPTFLWRAHHFIKQFKCTVPTI